MISSAAHDVIILGAGLAGLACARRLDEAGVSYQIFEAADGVGGRIRTDLVEGFQLDRGFQVFLTSYPEAQAVLDLEALQLRAFLPGALVRSAGRFHELTDPWRRPVAALRSLFSPIGSLSDKWKVAKFRKHCLSGNEADRWNDPETSSMEALQAAGFSPSMLEQFFRPFLGGIFLDRDLKTSSRMLSFVFRMFSLGNATLPANGMEAIPRQLAAGLTPQRIRFHARVDQIQSGKVILATGEVVHGKQIVVAADGATAARLLSPLESSLHVSSSARSVTCHYFAAPRTAMHRPILYLNGEGHGPINNLCFPTSVAPTYGPAGSRRMSLVSVTVLGTDSVSGSTTTELLDQLRTWFGKEVDGWRSLRSYEIPYALPDQAVPALSEPQRAVQVQDGIFVCGDHRDNASINGALASGRRTAEAVLRNHFQPPIRAF